MTNYHILSWLAAVLLFFAVYRFNQKGLKKRAAFLHYVLRVLYMFVLFTGFYLVAQIPISFGHLVKTALGGLTIAIMEIILVHQVKGETYKALWVICLTLLGATLLLGFILPFGIHF
ncbi:DUF1516 family protein [Metabacillus sp. 84]|uniref:DUF1516 family protein n=1 Tax=unclassified Metabacillus TaxID=2675274 RepID=UPI003CEE7039